MLVVDYYFGSIRRYLLYFLFSFSVHTFSLITQVLSLKLEDKKEKKYKMTILPL